MVALAALAASGAALATAASQVLLDGGTVSTSTSADTGTTAADTGGTTSTAADTGTTSTGGDTGSTTGTTSADTGATTSTDTGAETTTEAATTADTATAAPPSTAAPVVTRPANDDLANAATIAGAHGSVWGSTTGATSQPGEANRGPSIWWRWTAPAGGRAVFSIANGSGASVHVYGGSAAGAAFAHLAAVRATSTRSSTRTVFTARAGSTYYVQVNATSPLRLFRFRLLAGGLASRAAGSVQLTWSLAASETATGAPADALALAQAIAANPAVVTGASYVSAPAGPSTAIESTGLDGFPTNGSSFGVLSSGDATVVGNAGTFASTDLGGGNVRGNSDFDVTILKIDLAVPTGANCLSFDFRFLSEEYPDFVGAGVNDGFVAELDNSTWTTDSSSISAPNNFAFDPNGDVVSVDSTGATAMSAANGAGTAFDSSGNDPDGGATTLLHASTPITSGAHSLYLSIFDQGDAIYDSAAFVDDLVLGTTSGGACQTGATAVSLTKTADASTVAAGAADGYTITAHNGSSSDTTLTSISDSLPAGFSYVPGSTTVDGTAAGDPTVDGQTLTWSGQFTVLANAVLNLHFDVTASTTPGDYTNSASATASVPVSPTGPTAEVTVTQPPTPTVDLSLAKSAAPDPVTVGSNLTYTLTASNLGSGDASGVQIVDTLPASVTFVSAQVGSTGAGCTEDGATVTCTIGALAAGATATATIVVTPTAAGTITNTATVSSTETDQDTSNNTATVDTSAVLANDLALAKSAAPDPVTVGSNLTYTLTASNLGSGDASGVQIVDTLPASVTFVSAQVGSTGAGCTEDGATVTCTIGALAAGATATATIVVTPTAAGTITNTATVSSTETDQDTSNNTASVDTTVSPQQAPPSGAILDLSGCAASTLAANDDGSTSQVHLPFALDFFGQSFSSAYVNNNGNITFTGPLSTFTPEPLVSNQTPIIAPFWADVDTRGQGSGLVTYGSTTFQGHSAFCVDWPHVGYFADGTDKLNTFQLLLVNRSDTGAGNFDIYFDYGNVEWETGEASGGTDGLGGDSARIGYSNGTTAGSFELPGSAVNGAFLDSNPSGLIHGSRDSTQLGRYIFRVRSGQAETGTAISGKVLDGGANNSPVAGATVTTCGVVNGTAECHSTQSGSDGSYTVSGLAATSWVVRATPPANLSLQPATRTVVLTSTADATGQDLVLQSTAPDLRMSVDVSPASANVGQQVTFTYHLSNQGNADATNVAFGASVPAGTTIDSTDFVRSGPAAVRRVAAVGAPCAETTGGAGIVCNLGTVATGESDTLTMIVTPQSNGALTSTASFGSDQASADPTTATATIGPTGGGGGGGGGGSSGGGSGGTSGGGTTTTTTTTTGTGTGTTPTPPPLPPGNLPAPSPGHVSAAPVQGTITVNGQPFTGGEIPDGATIDATNGIVEITILGPNGELQTAFFFGGVFILHLFPGGAELQLTGGDFSVCTTAKGRHLEASPPKGKSAKPKKGSSHKAKPPRKKKTKPAKRNVKHNTTVVRSLWGEGKGNFRTHGRYSAATVRGTFWLTADRCDGTLTRVNQGVVSVQDFVHKRTVTVVAGHSYLALAPGLRPGRR